MYMGGIGRGEALRPDEEAGNGLDRRGLPARWWLMRGEKKGGNGEAL